MKSKGKGKGTVAPEDDPAGPYFDPWKHSKYAQSSSAAAPRELSGPTEARFQNQDEKIAAIEARLTQLHQDTQAEFVNVQKREQQNMQTMQQSMSSLKMDLEKSFNAALAQQSDTLNHTLSNTLQEMKALMQPKQKRPRGKAAEDMEDSG